MCVFLCTAFFFTLYEAFLMTGSSLSVSAIASVWPSLDERERAIVDLRLLADGDEATLADIGKQFGLSRERVRQLEARVKIKLRRALSPVAIAA